MSRFPGVLRAWPGWRSLLIWATRALVSPATALIAASLRFGHDVAGVGVEHGEQLVALSPQEHRARPRFVPERRRRRRAPQRSEREHLSQREHRGRQLREEAPLPDLHDSGADPRPSTSRANSSTSSPNSSNTTDSASRHRPQPPPSSDAAFDRHDARASSFSSSSHSSSSSNFLLFTSSPLHLFTSAPPPPPASVSSPSVCLSTSLGSPTSISQVSFQTPLTH